MLSYRDSRLFRIGLIVFFLLILGYAYYEGRALLLGPTIDISPRVLEVSDPVVVIAGEARRITSLSLNGLEIPVTEEGAFSEEYILSPGYNRIILDARDRYGKTAERVIEVIYHPESVAPRVESATSSPPEEMAEEE